ncbi:hypothetical protein BO94DRAFT_551083 [Aspergillus sclerotioniger CBS 115572]|uniref:Uncharacterized protein n=1 Tax=Aspergillus sclerotioniger CBS 115572 TaxID=1450535 RepID=A0A317V1W5_9EURO|nr:hypothetical protein BO94DRAFT_551083 [Aspergillus sclerotioniger CBS 115572]PWY68065.1 hypothetical protein BO94DRAFT_551083 [Aspergillus sclerotioniger CBS 115572]
MIYLSGESSVNGHCPVNTCQDNIQIKMIGIITVANTSNHRITYTASLREYIKRRYIQKMEWLSMNLIYGYSGLFKSEIDFCYHLYDIYGLINIVWLRPEPKPAVKRKRGTAQAGFINREHADFDHNASVHARVSSDNENNIDDILTVVSTLSSARTIPDLDLINPRLLEPGISGAGGITLANEVPDPPDDLSSSLNCVKDARHNGNPVFQSCDRISALCINDYMNNHLDAGAVELTVSLDRTKPHIDLSWVDSKNLEDGVSQDDGPAALCDWVPSSSAYPAYSALLLTLKDKGRMVSGYFLKTRKTGRVLKSDSLLVPRERRAFWRLKSQNLTWRHIMSYFLKSILPSYVR